MNPIENELKDYFNLIESFDKDTCQDADSLHRYLVSLTNIMARANYLMAEYGRKFREEKLRAYHTLAASSESQKKYYSAMLARDFIDAQCSGVGYIYDLAERLSRLCTHTIDAMRTIVSSLKSERAFAGYQQ